MRNVFPSAIDNNKHELPHPTRVLESATLQLLRVVALCSSSHADHAQSDALHTLCGLLRSVVQTAADRTASEYRRFEASEPAACVGFGKKMRGHILKRLSR